MGAGGFVSWQGWDFWGRGPEEVGLGDDETADGVDRSAGGGAGGLCGRELFDPGIDGESAVSEGAGGRGELGAGGPEAVADGGGTGSAGRVGRGAGVCAGGGTAG